MSDIVKVSISKQAYEKFESVRAELSTRGRTKYSFSEFLDGVLENTSSTTIQKLIESGTPADYRLKLVMENPDMKSELLKMAESLLKKKNKALSEAQI